MTKPKTIHIKFATETILDWFGHHKQLKARIAKTKAAGTLPDSPFVRLEKTQCQVPQP